MFLQGVFLEELSAAGLLGVFLEELSAAGTMISNSKARQPSAKAREETWSAFKPLMYLSVTKQFT